jgi:hypothetical protein
MTNPVLTLTLTTDELLAVLQVMGARTMNGLGDPLKNLSEQEQAARLNAGAETLLNRGLCRIEGEQLIMDDMMVAFVGASLIPDATMLLSVLHPDQTSDPHYFNATSFIMVEHYSPRPGIHVFTHLAEAEALRDRVATILAPVAVSKHAGTTESKLMADAAFPKILEATRTGNADQAQTLLVQQGWSNSAAAAFVQDMTNSPVWVGMVGWGLREEQPAGGVSVMLYQGPTQFWLLAADEGDPTLLKVTNPSATKALGAFMQLVQPLIQLTVQA